LKNWESEAKGQKQEIKVIDEESGADRGEIYVEVSIEGAGGTGATKPTTATASTAGTREVKAEVKTEVKTEVKAESSSEGTEKKNEENLNKEKKVKVKILSGNLKNLKGEDDEG
jgi:hypothetical protein